MRISVPYQTAVFGSGTINSHEHMRESPAHSNLGISFIEIVSAETFTIDGKALDFKDGRAIALWAARVAFSSPSVTTGFGQPLFRPAIIDAGIQGA